jgi:hypothetical protein
MRNRTHKQQSKGGVIARGIGIVTALILIAALFRIISGANSSQANGIGTQAADLASRPLDVQAAATKDPQAILDEKLPSIARITPMPPAMRRALRPLPGPTEPATFPSIAGTMPDNAGYGAIVQVQPPYSNNQYHIENSWYVDTDAGTKRLMVFAGNVAGPGGQVTDRGVLVVMTSKITSNAGQVSMDTLETTPYLTPDILGSLHITGAEPDRLIVQSAQGTVLYFDLKSRSYITAP